MEKKYYNVYHSNVNVESEPKLTIHEYDYGHYSYIVKEYKKELCTRNKKVESLFGTKIIKEKFYNITPKEKFMTYVEEINGKYYDIVTGVEVIPEVEVYDWKYVQKMGNEYCYNDQKMNKVMVESKKIKFYGMRKSSAEEIYKFLKRLTGKDVELYRQRMMQALANMDKVQAQRMSEISQKANEQKVQEDYISKFRENNGFERNRRR